MLTNECLYERCIWKGYSSCWYSGLNTRQSRLIFSRHSPKCVIFSPEATVSGFYIFYFIISLLSFTLWYFKRNITATDFWTVRACGLVDAMPACHRRIACSNRSTATLLLPSARRFQSVPLPNWRIYNFTVTHLSKRSRNVFVKCAWFSFFI